MTNALDLSRLPAPDLIEALDYETIYAQRVAGFLSRIRVHHPDYPTPLESDPVAAVLQDGAYRELLIRQRINDASRAVMPAYAVGPDLDHIAARYFVQRLVLVPANTQTGDPAVMESDDALRERVMLALEGFSTGGPELAYIFHARSASAQVRDASAYSPQPDGNVYVRVLAVEGDGTPSAELLALVATALNAKRVRPLTDNVIVLPPQLVPYAVEATVYTYDGPDAGVVMAEANARLAAYIADNRRLGRDITISGLHAALSPPGVKRVVLAQPLTEVACDKTQAAHCTGVQVEWGGMDE